MASTKKYLAFIEPLADYTGKEEVLCQVRFVTGDLAYRTFQQVLKTEIFNYYFWGTTFEVVYVEGGKITKVEDINKDTMLEFNIGVIYAISYNASTHDVLSNTGFLHNLDDSLFARHCKPILQRIYAEIAISQNFTMRMYTRNGAVISILFDKNIDKKSPMYKYALEVGFITANKDMLRGLVPKTQDDFDKNKKLTQEDIDRLFDTMIDSK